MSIFMTCWRKEVTTGCEEGRISTIRVRMLFLKEINKNEQSGFTNKKWEGLYSR